MKTAIVTTTIHVPHLLHAYAENARRAGEEDLTFIVVGDRKTPAEAAALCAQVAKIYPCIYLDVAAQEKYLQRYAALGAHLPYNCIQRRNVGLLWAYHEGAEVIVTIDDDNFVAHADYIGAQRIVGSRATLPTYASTSGWYNVCEHLQADDDVVFYHRGYPHAERWQGRGQFISAQPQQRRVVVNAGFWLDDPDIGALDRMARQPTVRGLKAGTPPRFALANGTWSPFNSQNTAFARDILPAYFLSPFIGRYDDIWASYIIARIADHLDDAICFGTPWVRQKRNPHDLWRDLAQEQMGMQATDAVCAALRAVPLVGRDYGACFAELVAGLPKAVHAPNEAASEAIGQWLTGMGLWHEACR